MRDLCIPDIHAYSNPVESDMNTIWRVSMGHRCTQELCYGNLICQHLEGYEPFLQETWSAILPSSYILDSNYYHHLH